MNKIEGTKITLTRGDSFYTRVSARDKYTGQEYTPVDGDVVRFALKRRYDDKTPLLRKDIPIDTMILHLEPQDTKPFAFGCYVYDIELTTANGDVDTFIDRAAFIITEEVD